MRKQTEQWKKIVGGDDAYISDMGNMKRHGKIVMQHVDQEGYMRATAGGKRGRDRVHVFVAEAFCERRPGRSCVNHKNENKRDNRACNLEWSTPRENSLLARHKHIGQKKHATPVVGIRMSDGYKKIFSSQKDAARGVGCSDSEINKCLHGKRNSAHGYLWAYISRDDAERAIDMESGQMRLF